MRVATLLLGGFLVAASTVATRAEPRTVAEVYTPGAETVWIVEVAGERVGHNWSRYEGTVRLGALSAHHFREQVLLDSEVPGGRLVQRYAVELWTDDRGRPLRAELRAVVSDLRSAVDVMFSDGRAVALVRQGPSKSEPKVEVEQGSFVLANNFVSHLDLALALAAPERGESGSLPFFSVNALRSFPLVLDPLGRGEAGAETGATVFRDSLGEELYLDDEGRLERVVVPAQKLEFRRVGSDVAPVERFTLQPPAEAEEATGFEREEVRIDYGDVSLAGTVTRPKGATGRLPGVFFVSGSGGQDRQGISSGIDLGTHEILDRLTREGFLVLRVDDRGVGQSTGPTEGLTFHDLAEDARQAVRYLQSRDDVDPSRIALIGHSEGGITVPILVAELDLAAAVLMAAPGRDIAALLREQLLRARELAREAAGETASPDELSDLDRAIVVFFERIEEGEPISPSVIDALPAELRSFVEATPWLLSHMEEEPIANLQEVEAPVLLLQGARDIQVSAERDAELLAAALEEIEHPDWELVVFPELDHLFKETTGGESSGLDYLRDRPVDPAFLDTLAEWLHERLIEAP